MAGGEGTRLRPLTCNYPKPMLKVANRPMMEHIIFLLKKHGITDIAVTLQYLPDHIKDYFGDGHKFGVNLKYYIEKTPLGTAGSVKNAQEFLNDTFIVISGDCLTDFDLEKAFSFHKDKKALGTLVLTKVDCPLEYGVVITDKDYNIMKFLEKPGWGEVFSDTVNTGIYILEPEVLNYFEPLQKFDFSQDLFPLLLKEQKKLLGISLEGYWCDIGDINAYLKAHQDILDNKVKVELEERLISPGVWIGKGVKISPKAQLNPPLVIGDGTVIKDDAKIDAYTVIGRHCQIKSRVSLKRMLLWDGILVEEDSSLCGAIIGNRVKIRNKVNVYEGAVIGDDSLIEDGAIIKPMVKLWPNKMVEEASVVHNSMIWGTRYPKRIFGLNGISGIFNQEITPEFVLRVASAYTFSLGNKKELAVSSDNSLMAKMLKMALISGVQSVGGKVYDLGVNITPVNRFSIRHFSLDGGIHLKSEGKEKITLICLDNKGSNVSKNMERKIENILLREDFHRIEGQEIKEVDYLGQINMEYENALYQSLNKESLRRANFTIALTTGSLMQEQLKALAQKLGVKMVNPFILPNSNPRKVLEQMQEAVLKLPVNLGVVLDNNGDSITILDEKARVLDEDLLLSLLALIQLKTKGGPVVIPITAPGIMEDLAKNYQGKIIRTKTSVQDLSEKILSHGDFSQFNWHFDALATIFMILDYLAQEEISLSNFLEEIPQFFMDRGKVMVPWEEKGKIIRNLIENPKGKETQLLDGVKIFYDKGWALVLPDGKEPLCRIFTQGESMEIAKGLTDFHVEQIKNILKESLENK